ncbi:hypothetical protein OV203_36180 [Nannocystis sp. ILAH1]|uniref:hypothetical protein n=1 Tax=unclassified Nannocystis TaxID=2627009 RepID=UPI00226DB8A3|nr:MULTISPECIES: hypothetical protein [unclassified Nannocystis]MCY0992634.1 hypothetical protein [Nannocystis sp. ILAH1]MCY1070136.1 hypothetical protein [Nannocystis sp. RBIL2]
MTIASLRLPLVRSFFLAAAVLVPGCQDTSAVYALIGPEGGELALEEGPTIKFPAGALVTTRQIVIRPVDDDLTRGDFKQSGGAYRIEPTDLDLRIPAEVTFGGDVPKQPSILWQRGDSRVVSHAASDDRAVAYIGALGIIALAAGGEIAATVDEPMLARVPGDVDYGKPLTDIATVKVSPKGTSMLDIGFTVYDPMGMSNRPLNGDGSRYCGLKFASVQGGSIIAGCSGGLATGSVIVSSAQVTVDAVPFLIGKVDGATLVEVQVGSGDLAHSVGYLPFITGTCYLESCSGHGACDSSSGAPLCMCDDGYASPMEDPLACNCVPNCDGRMCGDDGCGGSCGGCGEGQNCNEGQCEGQPPPETTTGPDTTTTGPDTTTSTGPDTTTDDTSTSTTTTTGDSSTTDDTSSSTTTTSTT